MNKYQKMVKQILGIIQINMDEEMEVHALAVRVSEALKKYDGKKVTRRMRTGLSVALPEHMVSYDNRFGMNHLVVNKVAGDMNYPNEENKISFNIGGGKHNPNFDHDNFVNHDAVCYLRAALERCKKRRELLKDSKWLMETAKTLVNFLEASKGFMEINDSHDDLPDRWDILELVPFELKKAKKK